MECECRRGVWARVCSASVGVERGASRVWPRARAGPPNKREPCSQGFGLLFGQVCHRQRAVRVVWRASGIGHGRDGVHSGHDHSR
eukprot:4082412-Pyramimonas_sp.AAC.1